MVRVVPHIDDFLWSCLGNKWLYRAISKSLRLDEPEFESFTWAGIEFTTVFGKEGQMVEMVAKVDPRKAKEAGASWHLSLARRMWDQGGRIGKRSGPGRKKTTVSIQARDPRKSEPKGEARKVRKGIRKGLGTREHGRATRMLN